MGGTAMQMAGTALGALGGVAVGASMAMPDFAQTITRRAGFYQASVASGGMMTHQALESNVRLGLGAFSTSAGSDSAVAAMLTTRGMSPTSARFSSTVTAVGQAARYLNMPNEVAASALEGLTSGSTSANMMRNFGVFTSDPTTGKAMGQAQIFEQLAQRFTGGGKTTLEGTMESLRRGNLGSNIRNSGLDSAQQTLLAQYMIDRSRGVTMDLEDPNAITNAMGNRDNPFAQQYRQYSKDNELMERATEPYITGMNSASEALIALKDAVKGLPDAFYELKGSLEFFMGDKVGQGVVTAGTSALGGLGNLAGQGLAMYGGYKAIQGMTSKGGAGKSPAKGGAPSAKASGFKGAVGPAAIASIGGNILGNAVSSGAEQGSLQSQFGNMISYGSTGAGLGAMVGSIVPGIGTGIGALIGGGLGALYGFATGGDAGNIDPGTQSKDWTGAYGEPRPYGAGVHTGVDIAVPVGTKVNAAMDGVVSSSHWGSGALSRGLQIWIDHAGGKRTLYAHLSKSFVKKGQAVSRGETIALSGNTGFSSGPHLHFQLEINGKHTNPNAYAGIVTGGSGAIPSMSSGGAQNFADLQNAINQQGGASGSVVNSFLTTSIQGVAGGTKSSKDIISSVLSSANGSLANVSGSGAYSGVNLPEPISGSTQNRMQSSKLNKTLQSVSTGTGGGEGDPIAQLSSAFESQESMQTSGSRKGTSLGNKSSGSKVTINLTIASASDAEARRFAKLVKAQLEEDSMLSSMGSK
jgi:murein DD-endopeptidase MepM/ murein hydrolase activator NlpD